MVCIVQKYERLVNRLNLSVLIIARYGLYRGKKEGEVIDDNIFQSSL